MTNGGDLERAERTFALAQELSEKFAVKHALIAKPLALGLGINSVVQPIKLYSKHSILFKCFWKHDLLKQAKTLQFHSAFVDDYVFRERLRWDLKKTTEMMMDNSNHSQCLLSDFQLVIDPIARNIIHIDIDRCLQDFHPAPKVIVGSNITHCVKKIETLTETMITR